MTSCECEIGRYIVLDYIKQKYEGLKWGNLEGGGVFSLVVNMLQRKKKV